jgi:hypothetical protein
MGVFAEALAAAMNPSCAGGNAVSGGTGAKGSGSRADGTARTERVVCFRYVGTSDVERERREGRTERESVDEASLTDLNRTRLEHLQLGGEAFLTSTALRGRYTLRACIVNYREDIDRMLEAVRALGAAYQRK